MLNPLSPAQKLPQGLKWLTIALLTIAVSFRFTHLDRKVYWHDEVYTSMVITAHTGQDVKRDLFQAKLAHPADLLQYQQFDPSLGLVDMLRNHGREDAQHPPLYYGLLRFWAQLWGTSPTATRSFSALLSLLVFPALYWLCRELFPTPQTAWVAIALLAVSPFHLAYAQEAREYSFWTAIILGSSALLLRAIRHPTWKNWVWYGLCMAIAFYTALFSAFVAIGHLLYVVVIDRQTKVCAWPPRLGKSSLGCLLSLGMATALFSPWLYLLLVSQRLSQSTAWTAVSLPWSVGVQLAILNFSRSFVDFNPSLPTPQLYALLPVLALQGYALYYLGRTTPLKTWFFGVALIASTALPLALPDLLGGGQRFTVTRYLIPCFLGLHLAIAHLISHTWLPLRKQWGPALFALLLSLGLASCAMYIQSSTWWNKVISSNYHHVAEVINRRDRPVVITDGFGSNLSNTIALSYLLNPTVQLLLLPDVGNTFPITSLPNAESIFLLNLPDSFRHQFETTYQQSLTPVFTDSWNTLWQAAPHQPSAIPNSSLP